MLADEQVERCMERLLRDVERIADGVDEIHELAITLAPGRAPAPRSTFSADEKCALDRIRACLRPPGAASPGTYIVDADSLERVWLIARVSKDWE